MKLGIMQPYLFPYLGYWQLLNCVDEFIILDDVNLIKRGFINRNYVLVNGTAHMFTIPLKKASQNNLIMDTKLNFNGEEKQQFLKMIQYAYKKAPYYEQVYSVIEDAIENDEDDLTGYIEYSLKCILDYLSIHTPLLRSSQMQKNPSLSGEDRILELCRIRNATQYINPIGGLELYHRDLFQKHGITLSFLQMDDVEYRQYKHDTVKNLSIIDVMMFNSKEAVAKLLEAYTLL